MTPHDWATLILLGGFAVMLILRVPVAFALILASVGAAMVSGTGLTALIQAMVKGVDSFSMLSIPFFILAGEIMGAGGISDRLIDFANLCVGWMRGGLAMVNCLDSMFFGGISGSAVADVSSLGPVVIPMMVKQGYDVDFAVGLTVTSACQGVLIPPSHNMVLYALAAGGVSVGKLFMGGLIPGMLLGFSLMVCCFIFARKYKFPRGEFPGWKKVPSIALNAIGPLLTIVIILGGVGLGICTATEAAAVACLYSFILAYFVFRQIKIKQMGPILMNALKTLAIVLTLIATSKAFAFMMTTLRIPEAISAAMLGLTTNKYIQLLIINVLLLFLGCIMDMAPLIMIMTPILYPVVTHPSIGMDPVHFGVMLIFNLAIGLCTPPVGSALFVGCAIGKTPIERTSKNMIPLYCVMVAALLLITYVPQFVMYLPSKM